MPLRTRMASVRAALIGTPPASRRRSSAAARVSNDGALAPLLRSSTPASNGAAVTSTAPFNPVSRTSRDERITASGPSSRLMRKSASSMCLAL
jgi:hypothetical protein